MRHLWVGVGLGLAALGAALPAAADVVARFDSASGPTLATAAPGTSFTVNVGSLTADRLLLIYDDGVSATAAPAASAGTISIVGDPNGHKLRVLIANPSLTPNFGTNATNSNPTLRVFEGLRDFGGISFPTSAQTGDALRDASTVAVAVNGDITGDIRAGRIFRVQALGRPDPATGQLLGGSIGYLDATRDERVPIAATGPDSGPSLGQPAINVVTAARGIRGRIEAEKQPVYVTGPLGDAPDPLQSGSVGRVVVAPLNDFGLQGEVVASGFIGSVFSTGPIGRGSEEATIRAGAGINEVRTIDESSSTVLVRDVRATIESGVNYRGQYAAAPSATRLSLACWIDAGAHERTSGMLSLPPLMPGWSSMKVSSSKAMCGGASGAAAFSRR